MRWKRRASSLLRFDSFGPTPTSLLPPSLLQIRSSPSQRATPNYNNGPRAAPEVGSHEASDRHGRRVSLSSRCACVHALVLDQLFFLWYPRWAKDNLWPLFEYRCSCCVICVCRTGQWLRARWRVFHAHTVCLPRTLSPIFGEGFVFFECKKQDPALPRALLKCSRVRRSRLFVYCTK